MFFRDKTRVFYSLLYESPFNLFFLFVVCLTHKVAFLGAVGYGGCKDEMSWILFLIMVKNI